MRKHLNADVLFKAVRDSFEHIKDPFGGTPKITLPNALMSAFAMFSLKSPSLLAFDRIRMAEEHNLKSVYRIDKVPCDTQMRTRLDEVEPESLRPAHKAVFRRIQRGKALEEMVFMADHCLVSVDGTSYFSSKKLYSPSCQNQFRQILTSLVFLRVTSWIKSIFLRPKFPSPFPKPPHHSLPDRSPFCEKERKQ